MSDYEPDPQTAKLFARYRQAAKIIKDDRKPVLEAAEKAIRQGAKSPELAAMTGMSGQTFRTLAEKIGVDIRTKPPTTGPEAEARKSHASAPPKPAPVAPPRATAPLLGMSEAPSGLGLDEAVERMSVKAARILVKAAEREHPEWAEEAREQYADIGERWLHHALLQDAVNAGHVELPAS